MVAFVSNKSHSPVMGMVNRGIRASIRSYRYRDCKCARHTTLMRATVCSASTNSSYVEYKRDLGEYRQIPSARDPMSALFVPDDSNNIKGVVHFLGGAFAGAAPSSLYAGLIQGLRKAGYLVVSTPYKVTFKHDDCARSVYERFDAVYEEACSRYSIDDLPCISIGHSNGALIHSMMSSLYKSRYTGSILIAFNNRQVKEAVPVPLDPLQAAAAELQQRESTSLEQRVRELVKDVSSDVEIQASTSQVGSVLDEVADGNLEFSPSPEENAVLISQAYSCPKTLIVQYRNDSIDQSKELFRMLKRGGRRSVAYVSLDYGSHVSPLGLSSSADVQKTISLCVKYIESRCV